MDQKDIQNLAREISVDEDSVQFVVLKPRKIEFILSFDYRFYNGDFFCVCEKLVCNVLYLCG